MNSATSVFFTATATTRGMPNTRRRVSITTDRMLEEPCEATSLMHGFEAERRGRPLRLGNHLDILKQGVQDWNKWRRKGFVRPDLSGADLFRANFNEANLSGTDLRGADLRGADLRGANLTGANLSGTNLILADLSKADLSKANLTGANLSGTNLVHADLSKADLREAVFFNASLFEANFSEANLSGTDLSVASNLNSTFRDLLSSIDINPDRVDIVGWVASHDIDIRLTRERDITQINLDLVNLSGIKFIAANLSKTNLSRVNLYGAYLNGAKLNGARLNDSDLFGADLFKADLSGANLSNANLSGANLSAANLSRANLTGCFVYAISAWDVNLSEAIQANLIITSPYMLNESVITVDNLEVAQFIYLLLNNKKIHDVIDTITSKVVLILGRFTSGSASN